MDSNTNKQGKKNYCREQQTLSQMLPKIIYIYIYIYISFLDFLFLFFGVNLS